MLMATTVHIPTIDTDRLRLRAPRLSDFDTYADFRGGERSRTLGGPFPRAESFNHLCGVVGHWHLRGYGRWIVADRATDAPLGLVGLFYPEGWPEPEIGWSMFDAGEGRGYAAEAALATRSYAYGTLGWTTVASLIAPGNTRSEALARRLGCTPERDVPHPVYGTLTIWRHPGPEQGTA
jgi:ribosomal-protein-alanine N-acetyltransferase